MNYYKIVSDGYVLQIGSGTFADLITEDEYNIILDKINSAPTAPSGRTYKLRADNLEWELVELPPEPEPEPTAEDKAEAYDILMGVSE